MDWLLHNQQHLTCFSALGTQVGDTYTASDNCLDVLKEIYQKLLTEDKVSRSFRRAIHFSQGVQNDILPLLISTKDKQIISSIVRILASLLVPVECLLPLEIMFQTEVGRIVVFELKAFLAKSKTQFRDPRSTKAITDFIKSEILLEEQNSMIECETINNCLLVLRNILHIPENGRTQKNLQNLIVWNLFLQNSDQILIHLMTHKHKAYWSVAIVQLIAVLYKDQHVGTLQKLLHVWFEGSLSDSSEDNESNTTPDQRRAFSPVMTSSELNSDSSDGCGKLKNNHDESSGVPHVANIKSDEGTAVKMLVLEDSVGNGARRNVRDTLSWEKSSSTSSGHGSGTGIKTGSQHYRVGHRNKQEGSKKSDCSTQQDFSDFGYGSLIETPEVVSTSSNEEEPGPQKRPFHQKPHIQKTRYCNKQPSTQEKKEIRRKKLMKRSKNTLMNLKALVNHFPRDEEITDVLKEFTVGFLLTGFEPLVTALHSELVTPTSGLPIDTSHFFWLLTYFLKFAGLLELDVDQIRGVLCFDILAYLVYEGVSVSEYIEQTVQIDADVRASLRRQHLIVTTIREFILALETFEKVNYLSPQDKEDFRELRRVIGLSNDLKCLFVLMLRSYRADFQNLQYLEDIVVTNHILLSFLEPKNDPAVKTGDKINVNLRNHLNQFASVDVMKQYGLLLENFQTNGEYLNDCIFTMMHHIGGEINHLACLCQPNILKTFTKIWESDFKLCEDWSDLIEYVIHSFVNLPRKCPFVELTAPGFPVAAPLEDTGWSKEDCENLYWYFALSCSGPDLIENIIGRFKENGVTLSRTAVIERLLKQGVITNDQYKQFLNETQTQQSGIIPGIPQPAVVDEITGLREALIKIGLGSHLMELQRLLLDTRHAKLLLQRAPSERSQNHYEPVAYYYSMLNQSIPVVCWSCDQAVALRNKTFQLLLRQLGFHLPSETGKLFFRIPSFWTPDVLLTIAYKLGPINPDLLNELSVGKPMNDDAFGCQQSEPVQHFHASRATLVNYTPMPNIATSWLDIVKKSKIAASVEPKVIEEVAVDEISVTTKGISEAENLECASVVSITDTQASDLTRMCISDEDEDGNPLPTW